LRGSYYGCRSWRGILVGSWRRSILWRRRSRIRLLRWWRSILLRRRILWRLLLSRRRRISRGWSHG
jgi:hypothetical protein